MDKLAHPQRSMTDADIDEIGRTHPAELTPEQLALLGHASFLGIQNVVDRALQEPPNEPMLLALTGLMTRIAADATSTGQHGEHEMQTLKRLQKVFASEPSELA